MTVSAISGPPDELPGMTRSLPIFRNADSRNADGLLRVGREEGGWRKGEGMDEARHRRHPASNGVNLTKPPFKHVPICCCRCCWMLYFSQIMGAPILCYPFSGRQLTNNKIENFQKKKKENKKNK